MKKCSKCNKLKNKNEFGKSSKEKDGLRKQCKECRRLEYQKNKIKILSKRKEYRENNKNELKERKKKYYSENKEKIKKYKENNKEKIYEQGKQWREANKEKVSIYNKEYKEKNKEEIKKYQKEYRRSLSEEKLAKIKNQKKEHYLKTRNNKAYKERMLRIQKKYYENNKDKVLARQKEYRKNNRDKINAYEKNKLATDINYKLAKNLRKRINKALHGISKSKRTMELLGCTIDEFKEYLERHFQEGMSWENYGEWHIDHIYPCSYFDFTKEENIKRCFRYTNMQPLWANQNFAKGSKVEE